MIMHNGNTVFMKLTLRLCQFSKKKKNSGNLIWFDNLLTKPTKIQYIFNNSKFSDHLINESWSPSVTFFKKKRVRNQNYSKQ